MRWASPCESFTDKERGVEMMRYLLAELRVTVPCCFFCFMTLLEAEPVNVGMVYTKEKAYDILQKSETLATWGLNDPLRFADLPIAARILSSLELPEAVSLANRLSEESVSAVGQIYAQAILYTVVKAKGKDYTIKQKKRMPIPAIFGCVHTVCLSDDAFPDEVSASQYIYPYRTVETNKIYKIPPLTDVHRAELMSRPVFEAKIDYVTATNILAKAKSLHQRNSLSPEPFALGIVLRERASALKTAEFLVYGDGMPPAARLYGLVVLHEQRPPLHDYVFAREWLHKEGKIPDKVPFCCKCVDDGGISDFKETPSRAVEDCYTESDWLFFDELENDHLAERLATGEARLMSRKEYDVLVHEFKRCGLGLGHGGVKDAEKGKETRVQKQ